jgi:hypothetical protein
MFHRAARHREQRAQVLATTTALDAVTLSAEQLDIVRDVALQLRPRDKAAFLRELVDHLRTVSEITDAARASRQLHRPRGSSRSRPLGAHFRVFCPLCPIWLSANECPLICPRQVVMIYGNR